MKKMRKLVAVLLAATMVFGAVGCGETKKESQGTEKTVKETEKDKKFEGEWVITADEAAEKVGDDNVIFVDARGPKAALKGTVEGAVACPWQEISLAGDGPGSEAFCRIPDKEDLAKRLSEIGLDQNKEIVFVGLTTDGWGDDGRLLWELREAGYTNMHIVDGGIKALKETGCDWQHGASDRVPCDVAIDTITRDHTMGTDDIKKDMDNIKIVDVRTKEEYEGATLYNEAQGGHLPGAIFLPYTDLFKEDGTLKPVPELQKMFEKAGLKKDDTIVCYCTAGIRSAYMQLVMEMCGYEHTYNYDQSYWRWAATEDVEK